MNKKYFFIGFSSGIFLVLLLAAAFVMYTLHPPDVALSKLSLRDLKGNVVNTANLKGKPTVVNFWATWCLPCMKELPDFLKAKEALADRVNFIFVSDESTQKVAPFLTKNNFTGNFYCNSFTLESIGLNVRPTTYFYDENGQLQDKHLGDMSYNALIEKFKK